MRAVAVVRITIGWLGIMDGPSFVTCLDSLWPWQKCSALTLDIEDRGFFFLPVLSVYRQPHQIVER